MNKKTLLASLALGLAAVQPVSVSSQPKPPAPVARPARPAPPARDPHTGGYVEAKDLPDGTRIKVVAGT